MSWVGHDCGGEKVVMGRSRCRHVLRRPRLSDPTERMRRSLAMLTLSEAGSTVGDLVVWFGMGKSRIYECLDEARAFRAELIRRKRAVEDTWDAA